MITPDELQPWLDRSRQAGRDVVRLLPPGTSDPSAAILADKLQEIDGEWHPRAADILDTARSDALLSTGECIYTLTASADGATAWDKKRIAVPGGRTLAAVEASGVDVERVTSSGAAVGHLVKLCTNLVNANVAERREFKELVLGLAGLTQKDNANLRTTNVRLQRTAERRSGVEVELERLRLEREDSKALSTMITTGAKALGPYLAAMLGPAVPGAGGKSVTMTAVDQWMAQLTEEESEAVFEILGPRNAAKVLRARGDKAVELLFDAVIATGDDGIQRLMGVFQAAPEKFRTILVILKPEKDRREKLERDEAEAAAKKNGAPAASEDAPS